MPRMTEPGCEVPVLQVLTAALSFSKAGGPIGASQAPSAHEVAACTPARERLRDGLGTHIQVAKRDVVTPGMPGSRRLAADSRPDAGSRRTAFGGKGTPRGCNERTFA